MNWALKPDIFYAVLYGKSMHSGLKYNRILLKLSGESLAKEGRQGIDPDRAKYIAAEIRSVYDEGTQIGIVVGGGNIFRGIAASAACMDRVAADHMGMLATIINSIALQDALEKAGIPTRVATAIEVKDIAEPYIRRRALRHFEKNRIVIFAGGTGNPFFTTDTAASLRAVEINAQILIKATKVDGIFTDDPVKNPAAEKIDSIDYMSVLERGLGVMDKTAISLCMENNLPIMILNMNISGRIRDAVIGEKVGSIVRRKL